MAKEFHHVMVWGPEEVRAHLARHRLAEAFFEDMVDLPGFEPRPSDKNIQLTGYNPKLSCPLTEGAADFKMRIEGVMARDVARNAEEEEAKGADAKRKELVVKKVVYRGAELADKKSLEEQNVTPTHVIHVLVQFKKKKLFGVF